MLIRLVSSISLEKDSFFPDKSSLQFIEPSILHAAWLGQAFAHCPIFPTAASRRSLARVSVPVWLIILSDQLPIVALVSRYHHQLTNGPHAHP